MRKMTENQSKKSSLTPIAFQAIAYITMCDYGADEDLAMCALHNGIEAKWLALKAKKRFKGKAIANLRAGWLPRGW